MSAAAAGPQWQDPPGSIFTHTQTVSETLAPLAALPWKRRAAMTRWPSILKRPGLAEGLSAAPLCASGTGAAFA